MTLGKLLRLAMSPLPCISQGSIREAEPLVWEALGKQRSERGVERSEGSPTSSSEKAGVSNCPNGSLSRELVEKSMGAVASKGLHSRIW